MGWPIRVYSCYWHILECFFFPPDIPAPGKFHARFQRQVGLCGGVAAAVQHDWCAGLDEHRKKHWLKKLLGILFLMAFVPFLNAAFQMFNASYYARWFYMLTLVMALATF